MSGYISLYSELIKKAIRGGPHRVAVHGWGKVNIPFHLT